MLGFAYGAAPFVKGIDESRIDIVLFVDLETQVTAKNVM